MLRALWQRLFSGTGNTTEVTATEAYQGFEIHAEPRREPDGWRVAGCVVWRRNADVLSEHFVRADSFPSQDHATTMSLAKGRQLVDERGEGLFAHTVPDAAS